MPIALVIDDNPDIRMLIKQALEMENFKILQAENGSVAKQTLEEGAQPGVILLDLMMPIMDGKQFLAWKNSDPTLAPIPVIIISALAKEIDLPGTVTYLRKPLDLTELISAVEKICR